MSNKDKTILVRVSEADNKVLTYKSTMLGIDKSKLLRDAAFVYWADPNKKESQYDQILKEYQAGDEVVRENIVNVLFEYYRKTGYPHNFLTDHQCFNEMKKLAGSKCPLLENDHLQVNSTGIVLANNFHPHMMKVKCLSKYRTPYEQYINDDLLKDAIKRWMDLGKKPNGSGVRRILRTRDSVRSVVNYKPSIAKFIYDTHCPTGGKVLDPCAGFSGRLSGLIASNRGLHYHGIDPMGETAVGNMRMAALFSKQYDLMSCRVWSYDFDFSLGCAEVVMPSLPSEKYDLVFTSPPYFGVEQYSNEPNQSYLKFPTYEKWREGFLKVVITESARVLKVGGCLVWNVKNYTKMMIADDSIDIAKSCGLKMEKEYKMRLSNNEYNRSNKNKENHKDAINWHTEPIFVFRK